MASTPDDAANLARGVRGIFADAENLILAKIATALNKGMDEPEWATQRLAELQALLVQVDRILDALAKGVPGAVEAALALAYDGGVAAISAELTAAGIVGVTTGTTAAPANGVAALVAATVATQPEQFFQIRRAASDLYQQVITRTTAQVALGVVTRREASRSALVQLAAHGVTSFLDKSGRRWSMPSYSEMAVRSSAMNAMLQGTMDRLQESGHDLVIVNDAPEECRLCRPFEGKVLSMSGSNRGKTLKDGVKVYATLNAARSAGLFHNSCRHSFSLYIPGITKRKPAVADPEGNKLREQQRRYERRIRELKRMDAIDQQLGGPSAVTSRTKLREKQAEFKQWREANDRKNLSYRTSNTAR